MKLIDLSISTDGTGAHDPTMGIATDSAIVSGSKPLFLADDGQGCRIRFAVGYRIGRLGKSIPARFFHRHIDGMTLVAHTWPARLHPLDPRATAADFSYATGRWLPLGKVSDWLISSQPLDRSREPGTMTQMTTVPPSGEFYSDSVAEALAALSDTFTLKSGDIVLFPLSDSPEDAQEFDILPDTTVTGLLNGEEVLTFRIK